MPDMECTWWLDGWPTWLGGAGNEWLPCCIAHDLGASDYELMQCVAGAGWPLMGVLMLAGLIMFGPIYRSLKGRRNV